MKKVLLAVVLLGLTRMVNANPYFRFLRIDDLGTYQPIGGSFVDPTGHSGPSDGGVMPLIYHSHQDGYLIIPGEDWALLSIGGASGPRGKEVVISPFLFNIMQSAQYLGLKALTYVLPAAWAQNVKTQLSAPVTSRVDLTSSVGPVWVYDPNSNKGYFRIFIGGALHF
jgi:hypothetical protein